MRVDLARAALAAALEVEGVAAGTAGPTRAWATADGPHRLDGVVCTALPAGGYEVTLYLLALAVPLHPLGERVRAAVARRAAAAGVGGELSSVQVVIADVVEAA